MSAALVGAGVLPLLGFASTALPAAPQGPVACPRVAIEFEHARPGPRDRAPIFAMREQFVAGIFAAQHQ
jgi:hypothetical protein